MMSSGSGRSLADCVRTTIWLLIACFMLSLFLTSIAETVSAADATTLAASEADPSKLTQPTQADIRELARLLSDERVAAWLKEQAEATDPAQELPEDAANFRDELQSRLDLIRNRATDIAAASRSVPDVPDAFAKAWVKDVQPGDALRSVVYTLIFIFIGAGLEWLFWQYMSPTRQRLEFTQTMSFSDDMRRVGRRGGLILAGVTIFAFGCIGSFLILKWSPIVGHLVLGLLIGVVALRGLVAFSRFLLAPQVDELRLLPLDRAEANRAFFWTVLVVTVGLTCLLTADTFREIGVMGPAEVAVDSAAVVIFSMVLLTAIWYWHLARNRKTKLQRHTENKSQNQAAPTLERKTDLVRPLGWTALIVAVAVLGLLGAAKIMWTVLLLALSLPVIALSRNMVNDFFDRATGDSDYHNHQIQTSNISDHSVEGAASEAPTYAASSSADENDGVALTVADAAELKLEEDLENDHRQSSLNIYRPVVVRLVRFLVVVVGVLLLAAVWDRPIWAISESTGLTGRLVRAAVDITIAFLIADLIWVFAKTLIDRRLDSYETPEHGSAPGPEARMATLLPLFRKVLMITVIIMVVLMALSSLGVNIGPLLAGAGVVGIAIGFGAQALVRDIVSGVFFLIDDAFRVGEYIEMGDLRGTVESMSLRSLRLRHHRGAVHTIPFGELTSLTNHSRDWAIIKLEFRVPFDTDLKLVKKLVKQVGKELQGNEDYGHHLIEPLKSQGVRRMEEFNMVVGVKFMSKPGEQWTIRRDAYQRIRDVFDENGISFAERNVKVEVIGDIPNEDTREAVAGAAQNAIETQIDPALVPVDDTP